MGESNTGGRTACSVRSPTSSDSPSPTQRWRVGGTASDAPIRSTMNQLMTAVAFGASVHEGVEVAGVVDVVVADEDPADVVGLDEAEHVGQELVAVLGHAGVDDDRLSGPDHHRVEGDGDGGLAFALVVVDQERVGRDLGRRDAGLGRLVVHVGAFLAWCEVGGRSVGLSAGGECAALDRRVPFDKTVVLMAVACTSTDVLVKGLW